MHSRFTVGKTVAFIGATVIAYFCWGLVFSPDTTGSNVVLGIALAIIAMSMFTRTVGRHIDMRFFHGGSRNRAELYTKAEQLIKQSKESLKRVKRAKKNREVIEDTEHRILDLENVLAQAKNAWGNDATQIASQNAEITKYTDQLRGALASLVDKHRKAKGGARSLFSALVIALAIRVLIVEPFQIPSGSMLPTLLIGDHLFVSKLSFGLVNPLPFGPKYLINWKKPKPGEIVVFEAPPYVGRHAGYAWVKRVIAHEGQTVRVDNGLVYVDDVPYKHLTPDEPVLYKDYHAGAKPSQWVTEDGLLTTERTGDIEHPIYMRLPEDRFLGESNWPVLGMKKMPGLDCVADYCRVKKGFMFVMGDNRGNSHDSRMWGGAPVENLKGQAIFIWMSVDGSEHSFEWGRFVLPRFRWDRFFMGV